MSLPVNEKIAVHAEETLRGVQMSAGYNFDFFVERSPRKINPKHALAVLLQDDPEKLDGLTSDVAAGEEGVIYWRQRYGVLLFAFDSAKVETPAGDPVEIALDQTINMMRADAEKALMQDPTRGGLAHDTIIEAPVSFMSANGNYHGVIVMFSTQYGTAGNDPYQSRA